MSIDNIINTHSATQRSLTAVSKAISRDPQWSELARVVVGTSRERSVHLGVFRQPFLEFVLNGTKTVESRFSIVRFPPFGRVARGDLVLIKASGGPVVGIAEIGAAWGYQLDPQSWRSIRREFAVALCAQDAGFWKARQSAGYATLMYVSRVKRLSPIPWQKTDRRGWVVIRSRKARPDQMKQTVIGFSGQIASGKTTLSEAVALSLACGRASFGDYVRSVVRSRGLSIERRNLQDVGEELVSQDAEAFCRAVLRQSGWMPGEALVVDGIRHITVADQLERIVRPSEWRLIHVATPKPKREERLKVRGEETETLEVLEKHSTERDVADGLPKRANLVVGGSESLEAAIDQVLRWAETLP